LLFIEENKQQTLGSPGNIRVPQAHRSVHAAGHQHVVSLAEVKRSHAFVDAKDRLVAGGPRLRGPGELGLLGLAVLRDLPQLLLHVGGRSHAAWKRVKEGVTFRGLLSFVKHEEMLTSAFNPSLEATTVGSDSAAPTHIFVTDLTRVELYKWLLSIAAFFEISFFLFFRGIKAVL